MNDKLATLKFQQSVNHFYLNMKKNSKIAVIYTHKPHYRGPIFQALSQSSNYTFKFFYDANGTDTTIKNALQLEGDTNLPVIKIGPFQFQNGSLVIALNSRYDAIIFLGSPYIVTYWLASIFARISGKKVIFWTHGWTKNDTGFKKVFRNLFYSIAHALFLYGPRAKIIGTSMGFNDKKLFIINNSLDYASQVINRNRVISKDGVKTFCDFDKCDRPYFLIVSRLVKSARIDLAIQAISLCKSKCNLLIIGDGSEKANLKELALALKAPVEFKGAIYSEIELAEYFLNCIGVVSPGKVGLLAMHALAYGAPVITHSNPNFQMPEFDCLLEGVTGFYFTHNCYQSLATQMNLVCTFDNDFRQKIFQSAIQTVESGYTPIIQRSLIENSLVTI